MACGFHASDPVVMDKTVALAKDAGVAVGAHPGYPDLQGFGRRNMTIPPREVKAMVMYQIGALQAFCTAHGLKLQHVKPHGALYNMAGKDEALAMAVCEAIQAVDDSLILLGLSGSKMLEAADKIGLRSAREVFADRAYEDDGTLVARSKPGAMITDEDEAVSQYVIESLIQPHDSEEFKESVREVLKEVGKEGDNEKANDSNDGNDSNE